MDAPERIEVVVGRIGKPHGLRGEVTVEVRTDEPERRFVAGSTLAAEPPRGSANGLTSLEIVSLRWHQTTLLVRFAEIADRTAAEGARGTLLLAHLEADGDARGPRRVLRPPAGRARRGRPRGPGDRQVTGVVHGAQDLLEVEATDGRPTLVPFVAALVPEVDVPGGRVVVADRPGLVAPFEESDGED